MMAEWHGSNIFVTRLLMIDNKKTLPEFKLVEYYSIVKQG